MADILMIADDMTGALDSGVMLSENGIDTEVIIDKLADLTEPLRSHEAVVVNTETRHLSPRQAYEAVYQLASSAKALGVKYIYKKTDSALRGNIGAELEAVLRATGQQTVHFAPAFPQQDRVTISGTQYINGVPLDQSQFAQDPLNPMKNAYVPNIIAATSSVPVCRDGPGDGSPCVRLYDAATAKDMKNIARRALVQERGRVFAGCAGFIGELVKQMDLRKTPGRDLDLSGPLMVFCGSMHELGLRQFELAEKTGVPHFSVETREMVEPDFWSSAAGETLLENLRGLLAQGRPFLFNTIREKDGERYPGEKLQLSQKLPGAIAQLVCKVLENNEKGIPMIIGGDTLGAFLTHIGASRVRPVQEIRTGVVLAETVDGKICTPFIAKAGSFGEVTLLVDLLKTAKEV